MILKIERHNQVQKWWLLDNIAKISCSKTLFNSGSEAPPQCDKVEDDIFLLDHTPRCKCSAPEDRCNLCIQYYRLVCRTKDYNEFSAIFDTVAYICNDDGKTIEKIVANYNEITKK